MGGGNGPAAYVALAESGKEVETAGGALIIEMQKPLGYEKIRGPEAFIKIVDQSTSGWGHVTADHFSSTANY